jgi:hypothetical protein
MNGMPMPSLPRPSLFNRRARAAMPPPICWNGGIIPQNPPPRACATGLPTGNMPNTLTLITPFGPITLFGNPTPNATTWTSLPSLRDYEWSCSAGTMALKLTALFVTVFPPLTHYDAVTLQSTYTNPSGNAFPPGDYIIGP